ncbi:beta and beta-prime subunits of DNA dependent RNA-polymerase [Rhizodiscina lignyota]|uniref:DNA-directed RNA polymerase subunit n=1 Tax=Rhizodiscina lignyota TaxID=1504668 RepID=A0A9P4I683_9PEZI|nr:beta and beta-prime subunits of DNA dependent RNA-polymerase [Rhizodiscina lignyota]
MATEEYESSHKRKLKEQVVDRVPKRIKELRFGVLSSQEVLKQSVVDVHDRHVYESLSQGPDRRITPNGPMDGRMGTSQKGQCETCGKPLQSCNGHFGHVKLALPCFHIGYLRYVIELLHSICKKCAYVLLDEDQRRSYLRQLRRTGMDSFQRAQLCKRIALDCRKHKNCPRCNAVNGPVRKAPGHPLKIIHMQFEHFNKSTAKSKVTPPSKILWDDSFAAAKQANPELERHIKRAVDDLNPLRVLNLFRRMSTVDIELVGMNPAEGHPEMFLWQYLPAPPVAIRPSVKQETATTEDDLTNKLGDIVQISSMIRQGLEQGQPIAAIMEQWEFMQIQIALYINSGVPGLNRSDLGKPVRGFCQRLKGKQGRFRGNLSGKRVDFSGRTVISPDPNLGIDEVAIPVKVACNLTYPERVTSYNIGKLRGRVMNGSSKHPGANYIIKHKDNRSVRVDVLEMIDKRPGSKGGKLAKAADELQIGDIVERHLEDGDIVLFNRQPSLHKLSILSHRAKIRPWRTFRLNECVCNPYNADFDGDEMNLHVPQTEEARAEAIQLMGVKHNLATPKNGTPIIAAIQDFITGAYLLSSKDNFYNRAEFMQICCYMFDCEAVLDPETRKRHQIDLPSPAIIKPEKLWTGKQVFNVLMKPYRESKVLVNLDAECKAFTRGGKGAPEQPEDYNKDDNYLIIRNSEVLCGRMDKATVGDGKKDSVFCVLMRDFGPDYAVQGMNRLAKLSARWLSEQGFSIGLGDVTPTDHMVIMKEDLVEKAYRECDELIKKFKRGKLPREAGCTEEETLENKVTGVLNRVRQQTGDICTSELSKRNAPMIMATAGSKGSMNNVAQMIASVGQQIIGGKRVQDGFQDRTLPHFPKLSRQPASKGFVKNSFYSGLNPSEFIFHAMSGREGLVDTAVKTAETGYMSRRLMKSLEDLSAQYDNTVRNSSGNIVQFQFGDDGLDPADMEGNARPVSFERTFTHAITSTWNNDEKGMSKTHVKLETTKVLDAKRKKYQRVSSGAKEYRLKEGREFTVDQYESRRNFMDDLEAFIEKQASRIKQGKKYEGYENRTAKISRTALGTFINLCLSKYEKSIVQPGHAVGAVGAQSIGEPGTQMTLKTFHFAGVAGMSITQGVPRIKEIINASKSISTPVISAPLQNRESTEAASIVKARIEKTYLRDILANVDENWGPREFSLTLRLNEQTLNDLRLDITLEDIGRALIATKTLHISPSDISVHGHHVTVKVINPLVPLQDGKKRPSAAMQTRAKKIAKDDDFYVYVQNLKRAVVNVVVRGYPDATRVVVKKDDKANKRGIEEVSLLVEGYGLQRCMNTEGVDGSKVTTNSVMETKDVLGIEAARTTIIKEIAGVMKGMDIDPRHLQLLADVMTYKGDVLGITRFGLAKMRDSVLQLASFEKTPDHLFEAAWRMKQDPIEGVSECIIMGQSVRVGTGASKVVRRLNLEKEEWSMKKGNKGLGFERGSAGTA